MECQASRVLNVETQVITWGDPTAGGDSSQAGSFPVFLHFFWGPIFFEPVGNGWKAERRIFHPKVIILDERV